MRKQATKNAREVAEKFASDSGSRLGKIKAASQGQFSVMDADEIIVMDNGEITGVGTHEQLLASNTEYQEIYYSQMDKKEANA